MSTYHLINNAAMVQLCIPPDYNYHQRRYDDEMKHKPSMKTGYLSVYEPDTDEWYLHCGFHHDRRRLVQVVCRHFGYKMGIVRSVGIFLNVEFDRVYF